MIENKTAYGSFISQRQIQINQIVEQLVKIARRILRVLLDEIFSSLAG